MSTTSPELRARNLRTVGALAALFLLPLLLSFWMYYGGGWQPAGRTNHGELLQPVRPLPLSGWSEAKPLADKWSLIYLGGPTCDEACRQALFVMRQSRLLLNQEMHRVNRVLVTGEGWQEDASIEGEHAGLIVLEGTTAPALEVLRVFPQTDRANSIYLVDPLGNLVMRYDARNNPKGLLQDLKKLLKLSHIG